MSFVENADMWIFKDLTMGKYKIYNCSSLKIFMYYKWFFCFVFFCNVLGQMCQFMIYLSLKGQLIIPPDCYISCRPCVPFCLNTPSL